MNLIYNLIMGTLGAIGFFLLFNGAANQIHFAAIAGAISTLTLYLSYSFGIGDFAANFAAALIMTVASHILAVCTKSASTIYRVSGLIPLVPGGRLYYAMRGAVSSDYNAFSAEMIITAKIGAGIAFGILIASLIIKIAKQKNKFLS